LGMLNISVDEHMAKVQSILSKAQTHDDELSRMFERVVLTQNSNNVQYS